MKSATSTSSSSGGGGGDSGGECVLLRQASYWKWNDDDLSAVMPRPSHEGVIVKDAWLHICDGIIREIGSEATPPGAEITTKPGLTEIKVPRDTVLIPGLMDAHIHVMKTGEARYFVDLSDCRSIEELQAAVRGHVAKYPDLTWIIGVAWDQSLLSRYPSRFDLDAVISEKPVLLWRACWHIAVANSKAIELAGLSLSSKEKHDYYVEGGIIDVDNTGLPSGIFRETAVKILLNALTEKTFEDERKFTVEGIRYCTRVGLTAVQTNDESAITIYDSLLANDELPIRVFLTPTHADLAKDSKNGGSLNVLPVSGRGYSAPMNSRESRFFCDRIKIFSDGSLGAETAAIRDFTSAVSDSGGTGNTAMKGVLIHKESEIRRMITEAKELGYRLEIHAIGDAAAEQVISALSSCGISPSDRAIVTHCQILGKDLIDRMRDLGIIANVQPSFVPTDMRWVKDRLDPRHMPYAYAWKTLLENGVYVSGGSDSPIENCNPFLGIYDAIMRRGRKDLESECFRPEECLTFSEALWIFTMGASYATMTEHLLGAINRGFAADMLFVKSDIFTNISLLPCYEPERVMVGGKVVYDKLADKSTNTNFIREDSSVSSVFNKMEGNYVPGKNGPLLAKWAGRFPYSCKCCTVADVQSKLSGEFCFSSK